MAIKTVTTIDQLLSVIANTMLCDRQHLVTD